MSSAVAVETRGLTKRQRYRGRGADSGGSGGNRLRRSRTERRGQDDGDADAHVTHGTDRGYGDSCGCPRHEPGALAGRIGYLPADPPVFDELTGREYLRYVARLRGLDGERVETRLDLDGDRRIGGYSAGTRTKLGLLGALLHDPAVVFLDEPTGGLDPRATRTVRETITDLADQGRTVFLSTHRLPVADELADTVGLLVDGALLAEGPPEQLRARAETDDDLEAAFLDLTRETSSTGTPGR